MRQIVITCLFFSILLLAVTGCLYIFGVMNFDRALSAFLKFAAAIVLLGGCAALATAIFGRR